MPHVCSLPSFEPQQRVYFACLAEQGMGHLFPSTPAPSSAASPSGDSALGSPGAGNLADILDNTAACCGCRAPPPWTGHAGGATAACWLSRSAAAGAADFIRFGRNRRLGKEKREGAADFTDSPRSDSTTREVESTWKPLFQRPAVLAARHRDRFHGLLSGAIEVVDVDVRNRRRHEGPCAEETQRALEGASTELGLALAIASMGAARHLALRGEAPRSSCNHVQTTESSNSNKHAWKLEKGSKHRSSDKRNAREKLAAKNASQLTPREPRRAVAGGADQRAWRQPPPPLIAPSAASSARTAATRSASMKPSTPGTLGWPSSSLAALRWPRHLSMARRASSLRARTSLELADGGGQRRLRAVEAVAEIEDEEDARLQAGHGAGQVDGRVLELALRERDQVEATLGVARVRRRRRLEVWQRGGQQRAGAVAAAACLVQ
nr:uncharacterized protein LOC117849344 [Setaria viridis]